MKKEDYFRTSFRLDTKYKMVTKGKVITNWFQSEESEHAGLCVYTLHNRAHEERPFE